MTRSSENSTTSSIGQFATWTRRAMIALAFAVSLPAEAQRVDVTDITNPPPENEQQNAPARRSAPGRRYSQDDAPPTVGRKAAQKYMGVQGESSGETTDSARSPAASGAGTDAAHYLAIHVGTYVSDEAFRWGPQDKLSDVGELTAGVTYRMGEWVNSMDLALRLDVSTFDLPAGNATKFSVLPVVLFPDASSRFPLYFGGGIGAGIMAKQLNDESAISLEYQLLLGARFFEVFNNTGFFVEAGIKNHFHLLSDGQYNGTFIAAGTVFTF